MLLKCKPLEPRGKLGVRLAVALEARVGVHGTGQQKVVLLLEQRSARAKNRPKSLQPRGGLDAGHFALPRRAPWPRLHSRLCAAMRTPTELRARLVCGAGGVPHGNCAASRRRHVRAATCALTPRAPGTKLLQFSAFALTLSHAPLPRLIF